MPPYGWAAFAPRHPYSTVLAYENASEKESQDMKRWDNIFQILILGRIRTHERELTTPRKNGDFSKLDFLSDVFNKLKFLRPPPPPPPRARLIERAGTR